MGYTKPENYTTEQLRQMYIDDLKVDLASATDAAHADRIRKEIAEIEAGKPDPLLVARNTATPEDDAALAQVCLRLLTGGRA